MNLYKAWLAWAGEYPSWTLFVLMPVLVIVSARILTILNVVAKSWEAEENFDPVNPFQEFINTRWRRLRLKILGIIQLIIGTGTITFAVLTVREIARKI